jgi:hypothetical protein
MAAPRKYLGADLIEEVLYDTELRFENGNELRPSHLQTVDMRMPVYRARNWDLMAVMALGTGLFAGSTWVLGKIFWVHRDLIHRYIASVK